MRELYFDNAPRMGPPGFLGVGNDDLGAFSDADEKRRWDVNRRCAWRIHGGRPPPPPRNPSANGSRPAMVQ